MGITKADWEKRIAGRSDLTGRLTHLTKPKGIDLTGLSFDELNLRAVDALIAILKEKRIYGSTTHSGYIVGGTKAVCFQDAPLYAIAQNVELERQRREQNPKEKLRYCGVGLSFIKPDIYSAYGGRPVLYEKTEVAKRFLEKNEWWRIVNLDYAKNSTWDIIDWTHEREWRVPDDMSFQYHTGQVHVIVYNPACASYFLENCPKEILKEIYGMTTLKSVLM
ncbi:DUF2971 domain-containing protein [Paenibacillus sp. GCM10023248]|uniref:DUF2971 domain-containing protein n=1 Tax=unclassified Paenibacillus TaxID=185978 RepID=UPI002378C56E|nr:DUF2971 domain-containing protein [Paenibacillus sp. MAHUQ-63]MDD9271491.1 DUF2971 domain-containing protein [Paenibacillus sp. MAHUQ-63]